MTSMPRTRRRTSTPRRLVAAAACAALLGAAGCGDDSDTPAATDTTAAPTSTTANAEPVDLADGLASLQWVLDGEASTPAITDQEQSTTVKFIDGSLHGRGPCNPFNGPFEIDGDEVAIGPLASTRMSCGDVADAAEAELLTAFEAVDTTTLDDRRLVLSGPDVELVFDGYEPRELLIGTWPIVAIATGGEVYASPVEGTEPTITFSEDGTVTATTGCNDLTTTWEADGDSITFGEIAQTAMACTGPEGVEEQEARMAEALRSTVAFGLTPERLTLLNADGTATLGG